MRRSREDTRGAP